jgi:NADPH:quinone reductase-like Zn-dependent oxidoreductase
MKANRVHRFGPPEVISFEDVPCPVPGKNEVLTRVRATGVGPWDSWIRSGKSVLPQPLPLTLGSDLAGTVEEIAEGVTEFKPGDYVYGVTNPRFTGANAEYAVASVATIAKRPKKLGFIEAASVPVVAVTAWQMLFNEARVAPGQRVLVLGGAGNVGAYAVQFAKIGRATAIATAGKSDEDYVRSLGADQIVDARASGFESSLEPVDAVIDLIGGDTQARALSLVKPGGVLISAVSSRDAQEAEHRGVRAAFMLVNVNTSDLTRVAELFNAGKLATQIGTVLALAEARQGHEILDGTRPRTRGKIVLSVDG